MSLSWYVYIYLSILTFISEIQLAILRSLKVFKFSFTVDSSQLNYNPDWLTQQFFEQQQRTTRQATRRRGSGTSGGASTAAPSNAQTGTGSSLFGGMGLGDLNLLSSLEKGVDTFINQAVKYLNESIVGDDAGPVYTSSNRPPHVSSLPPSSYNDSTGYHRGRYMPLFGTSLKVNKNASLAMHLSGFQMRRRFYFNWNCDICM